MSKQTRQQLSQRPVENPQQGSRQVRQQVAASGIDAVPSYIPQIQDPDLQGFLGGLSQVQPVLLKMMQEGQAQNDQQGTADRLGGVQTQKDEPSYAQAYFRTDGVVKGQEDASLLLQRYNTEFDKDKGDLEGWLAEQYGSRLKGIQDKDYIEGYSRAITPALADIRKQHTDYHRKAVETRVESNAMQLLTGGVRSYLTTGEQALPDGYISSVRDYIGKNLGVSPKRFDELLFETVRTLGDEGQIDAYEVLKKDHPDGTPGLYNDPSWRHKIDQAAAHSMTVANTRAQRDRDERQNKALYPVFAEEDPKKAQAMFSDLKRGGLFSRADDLIKWEKLIYEKVDGKPDAGQLEKEGTLLSKVYQGGVSYRDILDAQAHGDITSSQRKYLLSESRRVQQENRTLAQAAGREEAAIYKSREFKDAEDFLKGMLRPRQKDAMDFDSERFLFDNAQLAQAHRELGRAAAGKKPEEVGAVVDEITKRYMKRRQDKDAGYTQDQQARVGSGQIPFKNLAEAQDAARKGLLSPAEFRTYIDYFKDQNAR